jgi:peptidoglycan/LPS O-acetylase OafA/YrhL
VTDSLVLHRLVPESAPHPAAVGEPAGPGVARKGFNPCVHGARGLFSVMVFVFHIANSRLPTFAMPGATLLEAALMTFQYGVELFFGISGIVILGAMARARSPGHYAWDRITRIYPVLWASVSVVLLGKIALHAVPDLRTVVWSYVIPPPGIFANLLNPASWSLSFELAFYMLVGAGWALRRHRPAVVLAAGALMAMIVLFPRTALMLPGVFIGLGTLSWPPMVRLSRRPGVMLVLFLAMWTGIEQLVGRPMLQISPLNLPPIEWLSAVPLIAVAAVFGGAALLGIAQGRGVLGRVLCWGPMQWLGTISYSFYLWHPVVLGMMRAVVLAHVTPYAGDATRLLTGLVGFPLTLGVAAISHDVLEKRLTRYLRRIVP